MENAEAVMVLSPLTVLNEQYAIRKVLDDTGPYVVTYLAWSAEEEEEVLLHEYFPGRLVRRADDGVAVEVPRLKDRALFEQGKKLFLKEAERMRVLDHPSLAGERAAFEEHGTAYRVADYHAGARLSDALERHSGALSEQAALTIMEPVLTALHAAHTGQVLHGRIGAEAVLLTKDRRTLLAGVQGALVEFAREGDRLSDIIRPGLSPIEQYAPEGRQGPWTDVYAAAAMFYALVMGEPLPNATKRLEKDPVPALLDESGFSAPVRDALGQALRLQPRRRIASAEELLRLLRRDPLAMPPPAPAAKAPAADTSEADTSYIERPEADTPKHSTPEPEPEAPASAAPAGSGLAAALDEATRDEGKKDAAEKDAAEKDAAEKDAAPADKAPEAAPPAAEPPAADSPRPEPYTAYQAEADPPARPARPGEDRPPMSPVEHAERTEEQDDPEETHPAASQTSFSRKAVQRKMMMAVAGVIVLLGSVGGAALYLSDGPEAQPQHVALRAEADSLFNAADYAAARESYTAALALVPEEAPQREEIRARLDELEDLEAAVRRERYRESMGRAEAWQAEAEALREEGQEEQAIERYADANRAYLTALDNRPSDSLALARAQLTNRILMDASGDGAAPVEVPDVEEEEDPAEAMRQQLYARYRTQGEALMNEGDYEEARRRFIQALAYQPEDPYALQQLQRIDSLLNAAEGTQQYALYRQRADELFAQEEYELARYEYEMALRFKPDDEVAAARLEEIDTMLADRRQSAQQYQYFRAQGDVFFGQQSFEEAVSSYKRALQLRPDDAYVERQIARSRERMEMVQEAEREQEQMENGAYIVVDTRPQLIGGLAALHEKVEYPRQARRRGIEGRVIVQFVVTPEGTVRDAEVIRGIGGGADEEALRVIKEARFEPATLDGRPVPAQYSLWIRFEIQD